MNILSQSLHFLNHNVIQSPLVFFKEGILSSSKISQNIPSPTLYGPKEEGGLQLNHLYITQGLVQLEKFTQHVSSQSITGRLIRTSLELSQLKVGIERNVSSLTLSQLHVYYMRILTLKPYINCFMPFFSFQLHTTLKLCLNKLLKKNQC